MGTRYENPTRSFVWAAAFAATFLLTRLAAAAPLAGTTDVNLSKKVGADSECAMSKNPANANQLFASCNNPAGAGLFAARSTDGGATWVYPDPADKTIADGDAGQGPAACCDPTSTWDTFGNLYLTYIDNTLSQIVTILSTDGGATFTNLASFGGSVDQPTVVAANTSAAGAPVAVWIVWNQSGQMVATGAPVTGLGAIGAFVPVQTAPGTASCSFGDVAIAPNGNVVQACGPQGGQGSGPIVVNTDADGLGAGGFGAPVTATTTNVGGFDFIPPQNSRSVDTEAGLAFDNNSASPHFGRLYLVYTDETVDENNDTDIMLRFSDDNGATWSPTSIRLNDDPAAPIRSQFLPKIAVDDSSGNISVCWHDCRNSTTNTAMQVFCTAAPPTGASPTFLPNVQIGDGASVSNTANVVEFGDYSGLDYFQGVAHPIWGDTSNSTGDNPDGTTNFDAYTDRVSGGPSTPPPAASLPLLEIGPFVGGFFFDNSLPIDDGPVLGGRLGINVGGPWEIEAELGTTLTEDNANDFGVVLQVSGNVLYHLVPRPTPIEPFLTAGLGGLFFTGFSNDDNCFAGNVGAGVKFDIAPHIDLRLDLRDYIAAGAYGSGTTHNPQITLGVVFGLP